MVAGCAVRLVCDVLGIDGSVVFITGHVGLVASEGAGGVRLVAKGELALFPALCIGHDGGGSAPVFGMGCGAVI